MMKEDNVKHIVCGIDDNFIQHCACMLSSLFTNNPDSTFTVHIIYKKLSLENIQKIKDFVENNKANTFFYQVNEDAFKNAPLIKNTHLSIAAYFRILTPDLLPDYIKKALYLDSDIIILRNINELYETNLENFALAAAEDPGIDKWCKIKLKIPEGNPYFNSGVLLLNLNYWRTNSVTKEIFKNIDCNRRILSLADQDVLNIVLNKKWKKVLPKWNVQSPYFIKADKYDLPKNYESIIDGPSIIHFTHTKLGRPWMTDCTHPYRDEYIKYLKQTPWADSKLIRPSKIKKVLGATKEFLFENTRLFLKKFGLLDTIKKLIRNDQ